MPLKGHNLSVIIPAAGLGRRMKSYGPKALIELPEGKTVISRQLELVREALPGADVVVVLGFEAEKVRRVLPTGVRVVENTSYDTTNVSHSIELGLKSSDREKALVVYGDLVFNQHTLAELPLDHSAVVCDDQDQFRELEVGVNVVGGQARYFSYGLPVKWTHIAILCEKERELFIEAASHCHKRRYFGFEILNEVVDLGGSLLAIQPSGMAIAEIDSSKDIENARKVSCRPSDAC